MKKILLLTLSVLIYVVASAGIPPLTVVKSGGKWNKKQNCVTYNKIIQHYKDGILTNQQCLDPGNEKCPAVGTVGGGNWNYVEDAIQQNLEMYNMTTGTIQYNDATIYYKDARIVYDDEPDDVKIIPEVKGVEYNATAVFKK